MKQLRYTLVYWVARQIAAKVARYAGLSYWLILPDSVVKHVPEIRVYPPLSGYTEGVIT
jgi:hypothetical protein